MRGTDERAGALFSYVDLEARVRTDHPLRVIRGIANEALAALAPDFSTLYSRIGRPSIAPERLLRAMLLQAFYSVRSERQLMERLDTDLLFRWFVGLGIEDAVWDATVFSKNRDRLCQRALNRDPGFSPNRDPLVTDANGSGRPGGAGSGCAAGASAGQ
jgi:transposase